MEAMLQDKPGPLNQCDHKNMETDDGVHYYCPDCDLEWDDAAEM